MSSQAVDTTAAESSGTGRKRMKRGDDDGGCGAGDTRNKKRRTLAQQRAATEKADLAEMAADRTSPLWSLTKLQRKYAGPAGAEILANAEREAEEYGRQCAKSEARAGELSKDVNVYYELYPPLRGLALADPRAPYPRPESDRTWLQMSEEDRHKLSGYVRLCLEGNASAGWPATYKQAYDRVWWAVDNRVSKFLSKREKCVGMDRVELDDMEANSPLFAELRRENRRATDAHAKQFTTRNRLHEARRVKAHMDTVVSTVVPRRAVDLLFGLVRERAAYKKGTAAARRRCAEADDPSAATLTEEELERGRCCVVALELPWGPSGATQTELERDGAKDPATGKRRAVRLSRDVKWQYGDKSRPDEAAAIVMTLVGDRVDSVASAVVGVIYQESGVSFFWEPSAANRASVWEEMFAAARAANNTQTKEAAPVVTTANVEVRDGVFVAFDDLVRSLVAGEEAAANYLGWVGRLWGKCVVCGRGLTDEESRAKGVGPICLKSFYTGYRNLTSHSP